MWDFLMIQTVDLVVGFLLVLSLLLSAMHQQTACLRVSKELHGTPHSRPPHCLQRLNARCHSVWIHCQHHKFPGHRHEQQCGGHIRLVAYATLTVLFLNDTYMLARTVTTCRQYVQVGLERFCTTLCSFIKTKWMKKSECSHSVCLDG